MKKTLSLITTFLVLLNGQLAGFAQQKAPSQSKVGTTSTAKRTTTPTVLNKRASRTGSPTIPIIEGDFSEAVKVIQENYVEGKKLDYN
ncbi:MAG TPA: hypothetical protein VMS31_13565, partial [Pyrinomonadaceae bacterium]|nr:hypothetical protein [Pyrinomonadaceae bacterium]